MNHLLDTYLIMKHGVSIYLSSILSLTFPNGVNCILLVKILDWLESPLIIGGMYLTELMLMTTCLRNLLFISIKIIGMETCL